MRGRAGAALLALASLAACGPAGLSPAARARNAPFAADGREAGVDGLLVGHRLMEAGEYELALRAYLRAAAEDGIDADVLSALGSANLRLGRLGQAETLLHRALEADPASVAALNNLGVVLMEDDRPSEARVAFQQAFALDSGSSDAIRQNLRLAIAKSQPEVYAGPEDRAAFTLVRRDKGQYVLLAPE